MPTIEVSDEMYRRVAESTAIVRAVLDEDVDTATSFGITLDWALTSASQSVESGNRFPQVNQAEELRLWPNPLLNISQRGPA